MPVSQINHRMCAGCNSRILAVSGLGNIFVQICMPFLALNLWSLKSYEEVEQILGQEVLVKSEWRQGLVGRI